jgi:hypothetical protein
MYPDPDVSPEDVYAVVLLLSEPGL